MKVPRAGRHQFLLLDLVATRCVSDRKIDALTVKLLVGYPH